MHPDSHILVLKSHLMSNIQDWITFFWLLLYNV